MSVEEVRERFDDRFRLLRGSGRRTRRCQQTLEDTVRWSYELLTHDERQFLLVLGVFLGGFRADDAAAVAGLEPGAALDPLDSLVAKSMVQLVDSGRSISRYHMLETIRIFAQERAFDAGATSDLRDRHRAHFVALAQREDWLLWPCHARVHD